MNNSNLSEKCLHLLNTLCVEIPERTTGSQGNREATRFFKGKMDSLGWLTESQEFDTVDWIDGGATLRSGNNEFKVLVSPYSKGCSVRSYLESVSTVSELENGDFTNKIIFLHGDIAREQLMPKNFVFYNPENHQKIISLLEKSEARAIICATGRNAALAGGIYPFPLIEDGDFDIPSVYMTEEEGIKLAGYSGKEVILNSVSERVPGKGYNVIARKGKPGNGRIVITAHIDSKKGTPGAIDNATGVVVLMLLADLLKDYSGNRQIEIVAFNGEDYYSVPGQMAWISANQEKFENILFNINIDGAGYKEGKTAFSYYDLPDTVKNICSHVVKKHPGIIEGKPWPQGDHSIFLQYGRPALAVSSEWFIENIDKQDITHTPKDNTGIVDCNKLVEIAAALRNLTIKI
ncbi:MAG: M28 family peptidase [Bacteroidales bacterium]